ncbi:MULTISPECIES: hypothetical protein [Dysgonomonadaceae]|uniref:hypothetical protein n=1 Tax=Dysgonomonadaceae TaxID=2005520 RepID=UPI0028A8DF0B|nr:hypothetical protein [Proteiniphilum saccharofermentans]
MKVFLKNWGTTGDGFYILKGYTLVNDDKTFHYYDWRKFQAGIDKALSGFE